MQGFQTSMYASAWFLTMFASVLSLNVAFRVMDIFLVEGREIIFRVGLALLDQSEAKLMQLDLEDMLKVGQHLSVSSRLGLRLTRSAVVGLRTRHYYQNQAWEWDITIRATTLFSFVSSTFRKRSRESMNQTRMLSYRRLSK